MCHLNASSECAQKSERKKWINCFDSVTAVIFVASMSCYDEKMFEDQEKNSMTDQLELFDKICNEPVFVKTSMILFLNKKVCPKSVKVRTLWRFPHHITVSQCEFDVVSVLGFIRQQTGEQSSDHTLPRF